MRWSLLLFPFAVLYDLVTRFRNHLYNIGSKTSFSFEANVIAVGNLSVGGTGKSPLITYLIDHFLKQEKRTTTLSRGYGRKTSGYLDAATDADARAIGDEPAMYASRYGDKVQVVVCEHRALAIPQILADAPDNEVILLDDAYQHRTVDPSVSILLTTYDRPFYRDFVLPAGRLREARIGARRADIVLVTKCSLEISRKEQAEIAHEVKKYAPEAFLCYTTVKYDLPKALNVPAKKLETGDRIVAAAGIANAAPYFNHLEQEYDLVSKKDFPDHKNFQSSEVRSIDELAISEGASIVLTEKDMVKWKPFLNEIKSPIYYVPIAVSFIEGEKEFLSILDSSIKNYDRDY